MPHVARRIPFRAKPVKLFYFPGIDIVHNLYPCIFNGPSFYCSSETPVSDEMKEQVKGTLVKVDVMGRQVEV